MPAISHIGARHPRPKARFLRRADAGVSLENGPQVVGSSFGVLAIFIWAGAAAPHDATVPGIRPEFRPPRDTGSAGDPGKRS
jgi:hypothetical protein